MVPFGSSNIEWSQAYRVPIIIYWVPEDGRKKRWRPKKTWRSTFKVDLEAIGVSWHGARVSMLVHRGGIGHSWK